MLGLVATAGAYSLTHHSASDQSAATTLSVPAFTPTTGSLRASASTADTDAYNRRQSALRAIPAPSSDAPETEWSSTIDQWASVWKQYRADIEAITFPAQDKSDADQVVRDVTQYIDALQSEASLPDSDTVNAAVAALHTVDGDEQVLAIDLGMSISAPGDPTGTTAPSA